MKRIFSVILTAILFVSCCGVTTLAANGIEPYASPTLSYYDVDLYAGDSQGMLWIDFDVRASAVADYVGVEKIKIYRSNGTHVVTISGSEANGLILTDIYRHNDTYEYKVASGLSYYAEVTIFATVGSDSDSRTITTSTVEAP